MSKKEGSGKAVMEGDPTREQLEIEWRIQHIQHLEGLKVLSGGIANDLNNLLMTIAGNADLMSGSLGENHSSRERLLQIKAAVDKASSLTFQMLSYIEKGEMIVEEVNLKRVVSETVKLMRLPSGRSGRLQFDLQDVPSIRADVSQAVFLVMNMLTNASEAISSGTAKILVSLFSKAMTSAELAEFFDREDCPAGDYVFLKVASEDGSMEREALMNMFTPSYHTRYTGRGLGLETALRLLRNQCGGIVVNCGDRTAGDSVCVCFPADRTLQGKNAVSKEGLPELRDGMTVLVADDNPQVLSTTGEMLLMLGQKPLLTPDGCAAVEALRRAPGDVDCVILDLNMPDMSGKQTFSIMRMIKPEMPVILSSGYVRPEAFAEYRKIGLKCLLRKPYDLAGLKRSLQEAFA